MKRKWEFQERRTPQNQKKRKAVPRETEMDLGGKLHRRNMSKSISGNTKEAHLMVLWDYEKQEDVKLYGQLPNYDDSQCYDLGQEAILRQVALRIHANFHRPTWRALKHHMFAVEIAKKLFRIIKEMGDNDKRMNLSKNECLEGWRKYHSKIPSASW